MSPDDFNFMFRVETTPSISTGGFHCRIIRGDNMIVATIYAETPLAATQRALGAYTAWLRSKYGPRQS